MNPLIPEYCRACGKILRLENLFVDDGCPCNSARGVNFDLRECVACKTDCCVKPGHRLAELYGLHAFQPASFDVKLPVVDDQAIATSAKALMDTIARLGKAPEPERLVGRWESPSEWRCGCPGNREFDTSMNIAAFKSCDRCGYERPDKARRPR